MVNPALYFFRRLKTEIKVRRLKRAIKLIESNNLSVVQLKTIGSSQYILGKSGSYLKIGRERSRFK